MKLVLDLKTVMPRKTESNTRTGQGPAGEGTGPCMERQCEMLGVPTSDTHAGTEEAAGRMGILTMGDSQKPPGPSAQGTDFTFFDFM